jgi:cell wall-associated NlpC family hydrolase
MRKIASSLALHYVGLPYVWGGDDAIQGFDCSGFVIELLKSVGLYPRGSDTTAEGLFGYYKDKEVQDIKEGCLVFWATGNKITHVEYVWKKKLTIGASGGNSKVKTRADAIKHNAYVKVRPLRTPYFAIVDPFK